MRRSSSLLHSIASINSSDSGSRGRSAGEARASSDGGAVTTMSIRRRVRWGRRAMTWSPSSLRYQPSVPGERS